MAQAKDEMDPSEDDRLGAVERMLQKDLDDVPGVGKPLSRRARQTQRSVQAYLQAGVRPRWMERLGEIDALIANETKRLERAYVALREEHGGNPAEFAERWRALARSWRFDQVNELIHQHNEWFPIERQLPVDPRTRDYVLVGGRPYRQTPLGPEWVLEKFPA
jgi:hypothetical protein